MENIEKDPKSGEDLVVLRELLFLFFHRWYWFAISLFVSIVVALLYLLSSPGIYSRTASILVKDNTSSSNNLAGVAGEFSDFSLFKSNTNIKNEILTLSSPTLMREVVRRLSLNEKYVVRKGLKNIELYNQSPISVKFSRGVNDMFSFAITFTSSNKFLISDIKKDGYDLDQEYKGEVGVPLKCPVGEFTVELTRNSVRSYIGLPITYSKGNVDLIADIYLSKLTATLSNKDATIVNLTIEDVSAHKAEDILDTLIEVYNENWIKDKNQIAVTTSQFISNRLGVIEQELGNVDENISSYKSANLLPDLQAASTISMTQSAENNKELVKIENQLSTVKYIRKELNDKSITQTLPLNTGISTANLGIENQIADYNVNVLERNRLVDNSSETNPLVVDLTNSIKSQRRAIIQSVENLIVSLDMQLRAIRNQEANTTSKLASNPNQAKYLLSVERQQKVKEELYLYLLQKREENELSQAFTAYNTRIITPPHGSVYPVSPRKRVVMLAAFIIGLLIPGIFIYVKEMLNTKVRGRKDIDGLNIPFIGEIPLFRSKGKQANSSVVVSEGIRNPINEAFRVLRSNVDFITSSNKLQNVSIVTSFNPGSGKSFITINMAICFAIKKKRVLIIDGDMRHGTLSTFVDSPVIGLSDYLGGRINSVDDAVVQYDGCDTLYVLPIGTVPPNPTELLENDRFTALINSVRDKYDYIFIDCPPIDVVADTQIIEKHCNRTIFVVRAGLLERCMLDELKKIYEEKRFNNLSMILNGTESSRSSYHYRYGYSYGYSHGYNYGYQ